MLFALFDYLHMIIPFPFANEGTRLCPLTEVFFTIGNQSTRYYEKAINLSSRHPTHTNRKNL